jgi:TonB family protein
VKALASGPISTLPSLPIAPSPEPITPDDNVYTAAEEGVVPAVLTRPQLPSEPPSTVPKEEVGVLEIVVSPTGTVEHARLISTANRYEDRMIVSAVKAWRFEPAMKDGRPVRYRTWIRVTL